MDELTTVILDNISKTTIGKEQTTLRESLGLILFMQRVTERGANTNLQVRMTLADYDHQVMLKKIHQYQKKAVIRTHEIGNQRMKQEKNKC